MDIFAGLRDKLRFIERFYQSAAQPFEDTKRKIDEREPPFEEPNIDPEDWNGEPFYLDEWIEADECHNLVGQACLSLVQACLKEYMEAFVDLSGRDRPRGGNWFARYKIVMLPSNLDSQGLGF